MIPVGNRKRVLQRPNPVPATNNTEQPLSVARRGLLSVAAKSISVAVEADTSSTGRPASSRLTVTSPSSSPHHLCSLRPGIVGVERLAQPGHLGLVALDQNGVRDHDGARRWARRDLRLQPR